MMQINLLQAKDGQGTSVTACAVALHAAKEGWQVRLDGHDRHTLAAIIAARGDGPVLPGLVLGADSGERYDLVVHDGPADTGTGLLVIRPCYLALRRALNGGACPAASAVVVVAEPGRALDDTDVAAVTGLPVIATVALRADIARAVDAGVLADRLPDAAGHRCPSDPAPRPHRPGPGGGMTMGHTIEDLQRRIEAGVADLVAGEGWRRWLTVAARFPKYRTGAGGVFELRESGRSERRPVRSRRRSGRRRRSGLSGLVGCGPQILNRCQVGRPAWPKPSAS